MLDYQQQNARLGLSGVRQRTCKEQAHSFGGMQVKFKSLVLILLTLVTTMFGTTLWAANGHGSKKKNPPKQMTDAAGRTHVRPSGKITDAQKKAAARQRKARVRARSMRPNVRAGVR